jgi:hypothetical protein
MSMPSALPAVGFPDRRRFPDPLASFVAPGIGLHKTSFDFFPEFPCPIPFSMRFTSQTCMNCKTAFATFIYPTRLQINVNPDE